MNQKLRVDMLKTNTMYIEEIRALIDLLLVIPPFG